MKHYVVRALVACVAVALAPAAVHACGEKLLALGRMIRFESRHSPRPASVLLYAPQSGTGRPIADPNLESALKEAGHAVRAATTIADLESALDSGAYDVVLANITDAPEIQRAQAVAAAHAVVLPAIYLFAPAQQAKQQARTDRAAASKAFGVLVEVPGRPGHYCAAVDKAMDLKLKRERSIARRP
jgi:hypothetical protein